MSTPQLSWLQRLSKLEERFTNRILTKKQQRIAIILIVAVWVYCVYWFIRHERETYWNKQSPTTSQHD